MATSWAQETDEHVNYTKLCRLIYDGGTIALKTVFDKKCPPTTLTTKLATNQAKLLKLKKPKGRVLSQDQWDLLYPPSGGSSKSEDFDITLLFVLLRNICSLKKPKKGWDALPSPTDTTFEANLARIKYYRNTVTAHCSRAAVDETQFQAYWKDISSALEELGLKKVDIEKLESSPLGEKEYNRLVEYWDLCDKEMKQQLEAIKSTQLKAQLDIAEIKSKQTEIDSLAHIDYTSLIKNGCKKYHQTTRQWIFDQVKSNMRRRKSPEETVVLIRAGPGMGKSIVAAKICDIYKTKRLLGGCHFFQHSDSLRNNPRIMLQSISRQLCNSVPGYQAALVTKLKTLQGRNISDLKCEELLGVLFEEPLSQIHTNGNVVIVIDALDECASQFKNELENAFNKKLSLLPPQIRFVITTRPLPSFRRLPSGVIIEINPSDPRNIEDIKTFMGFELAKRSANQSLIAKLMEISEGLFLVAFFVFEMLNQFEDQMFPNAIEHLSRGIAEVYEHYFSRIKNLITPYLDKSQSDDSFHKMLEAVVASESPIPKQMLYEILRLKSADEVPREKRKERNDSVHLLHTIFPVENDHITAFHKTVIDWLKGDANDNPEFSVSTTSGVKVLAEKSLEVLVAFNEEQKDLNQPFVLSDCETFAVQFGIGYVIESSDQLNEYYKVKIFKNINVIAAIVFFSEKLQWKGKLSEKCKVGNKFLEYFLIDLFKDGFFLKETTCFGHCFAIAGDYLLNFKNSPLSPEEKEELRRWFITKKLPHYSCHNIFQFRQDSFRRQLFYANGVIAAIDCEEGLNIFTIRQGGNSVKKKTYDKSNVVGGVSPDKKNLIIASPNSGKIELYDVITLEKVQRYDCPTAQMHSFYIFRDAEDWFIVIEDEYGNIYILNGLNGQLALPVFKMVGSSNQLQTVSQHGHLLFVCKLESPLGARHVELQTVHFRRTDGENNSYEVHINDFVNVPPGNYRLCRFSDDGNYLAASVVGENKVFVFHTSGGTVYRIFSVPPFPVCKIVFISSSCLILKHRDRTNNSVFVFYEVLSEKLIYYAHTSIDYDCDPLVVPPQGTDKFTAALFGFTSDGELLKLEFQCLEESFLDSA